MKLNKYGFCAILLSTILFVGIIGTKLYLWLDTPKNEASEESFVIVTSFYPMYVATANLVSDLDESIVLEVLSEPQTGCLHDYQVTTEDMQLLAEADVLVINGGGAENFLEDVLNAYPELIIIDSSLGLEQVHDEHEEVDEQENEESHAHEGHSHGEMSHIWMCPSDYKEQLRTIASGLVQLLPEYEEQIRENEKKYSAKVDVLCEELEEIRAIVQDGHVVILHESFEPFCEESGMEILAGLNLDEEGQISSGEVAKVLDVIHSHPGTIVLAEETYGTDMAQMLQRETNVTVVYLNPLTRGELEKDGYITGMQKNIQMLKEALLPCD